MSKHKTLNGDDDKLLLLTGDYNTCSNNKSSSLWNRDVFPWIKCRVVVAIMIFLGFVNVYSLRVNLSMAIEVMSNNTDATTHYGQYKTVGKPKVYNWTGTEQGWLLGAFFCGYLFTQIPGALLAQKFGGKYVFGIGVFMTAVLTLFTPVAADISVWVLVLVRALEGIFEGLTVPAANAMFGLWTPPKERSRMVAFTFSGQCVGSFISFPLTALLCVYGFDGGWPSAFYIFGVAGIIWFIFWLLLAYSSPATHPRISEKELKYIERSIEEETKQCSINQQSVRIPWLQMLLSPAVWGLIIAIFCNMFGFYTLLTIMPTYFAQVLELNLGDGIIMNGVYSSITYIVQFVFAMFVGPLADLCIAHCLSVTVTRKLFTCSGFILSALFITMTAYFETSRPVAIALISLSNGAATLSLGGYMPNSIEMAPRFASIIMGIINTAGTLSGIIAPVIAEAIVHSHNAPRSVYIEEWREVFLIVAEIYLFGAAIYAILGDGKKQWWADGVTAKRR